MTYRTLRGAPSRGRTGTPLCRKAADFKSAVSTNFTIGAPAARQASGQRNRSSTSTQATDTFTTSQPLLPRKKGSLSFPFNFGAGNRSRTDDLNLGKVALYQLSYSRKLSTHAIQRIRFKQSRILLLISAVMQTNTETCTRQTKPKLAATTPSHHMHCTLMNWRRGPESNRPQRICNPTHNRFATAPNLTSWQKRGMQKLPLFAEKWSGKSVSNRRPQPWQGCALPTELFPHFTEACHYMAFRIDGVNCSLLFESHKKKADFFHQCFTEPCTTSPPGATATAGVTS